MPCTPDAMASFMDNAMEPTMDDATDHAMDNHSSMDYHGTVHGPVVGAMEHVMVFR